ncbi:MAG: hypothetical protein KIT16_02295 [Rhodospirillaceae bacterium]|nr:hypothetical protein [Rhodospirillaceae bacterium]
MSSDPIGAGAGPRAVRLPWEPDGTVAANFAIGHLRETLLKLLADHRGVHAETAMAAIGAITGHAAIHAVWETMTVTGRTPPLGLYEVKTTTGETYYFGDSLNAYLVQQDAETLPLWAFLAAGAVEAGVPAAELPDAREMFAYAAGAVGSGNFGVLRVAEANRPRRSPRECLDAFWPVAKSILSSDRFPGAQGRRVAVQHWPIVAGIVAKQLLVMSKSVLDPRIAFRLCMEAAIFMSKIDPRSVPQTPPRGAAS